MAVLNAFLDKVVTQVVDPIILLLATGAFVAVLWGIFEFIRHAGDATKRAQGQEAIMWGIVGLIIIFGVYGILNLALGTFGFGSVTPISQ